MRPITALLKKGAKFELTEDHAKIVRGMLDTLSGPEVLAFPCYDGEISGDRPFRLVVDASTAGLGAVIDS